ncbi:dihydropteroate synthase [Sedimentisphaera salicampi]|uniref:dihydropteroate synthase n=1 Tax=Sedimentisphaera salicampi TaxID=1941349 RepID=UPI000B9C392C|nr:dihydropteroate synthase [Sedimentisphaera salicampi]OXU15418.1 5-methyltetrahydrofolate:corrinoid/iron-sulfur protein co-methyltransferase [Sedimentisphaera salicampi]
MTNSVKDIIKIGESVHASIPSMNRVMKVVFENASGSEEAVEKICEKIRQQAENGADYIEVNVDDFYAEDSARAEEMMRQFVQLTAEHGRGVPVCVDSSNDELIIAGLEAWQEAGAPERPMVNSVKPHNMDRLFELSRKMPFVFIALIMIEQGSSAEEDLEKSVSTAEMIFDKAIEYGFKPEEMYFDTSAFPLAIDLPMNPGQPGRTWLAFETIKAIKSNPKFEGVRCSLGISNCFRDIPGSKNAIAAAYLGVAMEYGLDAGIVNVCGKLLETEPDEKLTDMVRKFASLDGSPEKLGDAMTAISTYCTENR